MVKKSTDYIKLRKFLDEGKIIPMTFLTLYDDEVKYCYGSKTNYEVMMAKLRTAFPSEWVDEFRCIWWYCAGREAASKDVPATMDHGGQYLFSGFDGAVVSLLLGGEAKIDEKTGKVAQPTMEEMVNIALTQEVLTLVQ